MMEHGLSDTLTDSSEGNMTLSSVASGNDVGGISQMRQGKLEDFLFKIRRYTCMIKDTSPPSDYGYSPERNINEQCASSAELSNPGSVLSPNKAMHQIGTNFKDELLQTQKYRKSMQSCFKKIKDNIDIVSMTEKAVNGGLVKKEDLSWFKTNKRAKKADLFVTKIIQTIELDKIPEFEAIIGKSIADQIGKCGSNIPARQEIGTRFCNTKLQRLRAVLYNGLQPDDVEDLKDFFIENFIIDIDENEAIICHPGYVIPRNKALKFVQFFVDEYIIKKESIGSFQWLVQFLQKTNNSRLSHILLSLIDGLNENLDHTEPRSEVNKKITVEQVVHDVKETQIESKNVKISLEFQDKDDQTNNVCQKMVSTVKSKNGIIAATFGGIITDSNVGSVIIYLTSLDKYTLQRIINSISDGQFSKVLELLFKDDEIKRIIAPGNYKLEMNVCVCDDLLSINQIPVRKTSLTQTVKDNRSFLREEIDTLLVLKTFRGQGIDVESDIEEKDRSYRAEYLINIAISNIEAAELLYSTLKEMSHVQDRLKTYERVYTTDPIHVCKQILNNFSNISEAVDLADIRLVFVERCIFEDKQLDNIETEFGQKRIDVMSVFLAEVMQKGNDAMLTLVDALFVLELDDLAESLITEYTDIFEEFSLSKESTNSIVKKKDSVLTEVSVVSATFVIRVSKGDECKSIVTPCVDNKDNSLKVIQLDDTKTSSISSPQEQESHILETKGTGEEYTSIVTACKDKKNNDSPVTQLNDESNVINDGIIQDKVEALCTECDKLRVRARDREEKLLRDYDIKVQILEATYRHMPTEIDKLEQVIESKNNKILKLTNKNIDLGKAVGELNIAKDEVLDLSQKIEHLEAIIEMKTDHEKQMKDKCQILMRKTDKVSKVNKRLSMKYETLMLRLSKSESSMEDLLNVDESQNPGDIDSPVVNRRTVSDVVSEHSSPRSSAYRRSLLSNLGEKSQDKKWKRKSTSYLDEERRKSPSRGKLTYRTHEASGSLPSTTSSGRNNRKSHSCDDADIYVWQRPVTPSELSNSLDSDYFTSDKTDSSDKDISTTISDSEDSISVTMFDDSSVVVTPDTYHEDIFEMYHASDLNDVNSFVWDSEEFSSNSHSIESIRFMNPRVASDTILQLNDASDNLTFSFSSTMDNKSMPHSPEGDITISQECCALGGVEVPALNEVEESTGEDDQSSSYDDFIKLWQELMN